MSVALKYANMQLIEQIGIYVYNFTQPWISNFTFFNCVSKK